MSKNNKRSKKRKNREKRKSRRVTGIFSQATGESVNPNEPDNGDEPNNGDIGDNSPDEEKNNSPVNPSIPGGEDSDKEKDVTEELESQSNPEEVDSKKRSIIIISEIPKESGFELSEGPSTKESSSVEPRILQEPRIETKDKKDGHQNFQEEPADSLSASENCPHCKKRLTRIRLVVEDRDGKVRTAKTVFAPCDCPEYFGGKSRIN